MTGRWVSLRKTVKRLLRAPGFTFPAFLILVLGIGATTAIFSVVRGVVLEPLPFPESDRLVTVCEQHPEDLPWCGVASVATVEDLREESTAFEDLGIVRNGSHAIRDDEGVTSMDGSLVTPGLLELFRTPPALGRLFAPDEMGPDADDVVILSHGLWTRRYGADPAVLGRTVDVEGDVSSIVGVMPEGFEIPGATWVQFWKPIPWELSDPELRSWRGMRAYGRLRPGTTLDEARADLARIYDGLERVHEAITPEWRVSARLLLDLVVGPSTRTTLYVFLGAVGLLLVIGCLNVANLLLVRGARRERDFAIRHAMGARRGSLVAEVLTESFLLAGAAGIVGLGLAWAGLRVFPAIAPPFFPRLEQVGIDWGILGFVVLVTGATAVVFGLLPAMRSAEANPAAALRGGRGASTSVDDKLRRGLVVAELALSMVLLASAGLLTRSFVGYRSWDPGFDPDGLVFFQVFAPSDQYSDDASTVALWREMEDRLEALPGVESVGTASGVLLRNSPEPTHYRVSGEEGVAVPELPTARYFDVGPGYFETMGVEVVRGREFRESDDLGSAPVAVVSETFARRAWPDRDPVGRTVWVDRLAGSLDVVGLVADLDPLTPGETAGPVIYWPNRQRGVRTATHAERIREEILALDPGLAAPARGTVDSILRSRLARPRFNMLLVGLFAGVAVILAALGTYGVLAYLVVERTREFGIRVALGSSRGRILGGVLREGLLLAGAGVVLGVGGALAGSGILRGVIHGIEPTDPVTLSTTSLLLVVLALAACAVPALRASRVDPVKLLKEE